ncbi:MAG: GtrA family protein [Clostridium sp.]|nr:GtrA family protein [Clostridium sp.]
MISIKKFKENKKFIEIFRFVITGGLSFVVDYGILFLLTEFMGINYLISSGISFTFSVIVNYILCVKWVFDEAKQNDKRAVIIFIGSSVIGLIFNQILMWLFVSVFNIYYMISKIITTLIVMVWNYIMKKMALVKS